MSLSRKKVLTRKCISLFAIGFMLAMATSLTAQTATKITLPKQQMSLSELFQEIEKQTGYVVISNPDKVDGNKEFILAETTGLFTDVLDKAFAVTGQIYRINGKYIVVLTEEKKAAPAKPAKASASSGVSYVAPSYYSPQPSSQPQPRFESNTDTYPQSDFREVKESRVVGVRYDTIRVEGDADHFSYPDRSAQLMRSRREIIRNGQSYLLDTPPAFALKTNLLYWATGTLNLSAEIGLAKKSTLDIMASYNPWNLNGTYENNKKLVHFIVRPEYRYWFCERFNGHFLGVHAFYWQYNINQYNVPLLFEKEYRYEGNAVGAGLSYGYHWAWSKHWGMEFNFGLGVAFLDYKKSDCVKCGAELGEYKKTYAGPTNIGIKLVYVIK